MRVLIFGSRSLGDRVNRPEVATIVLGLQEALLYYVSTGDEVVIIHGGVDGADEIGRVIYRCVRTIVKQRFPDLKVDSVVREEVYKPDWGMYGKGAGPIRNVEMVEKGEPTCAYGFIDKPLSQSRGSKNMVGVLKVKHVPYVLIDVSEIPDVAASHDLGLTRMKQDQIVKDMTKRRNMRVKKRPRNRAPGQRSGR